MNDPRPLVPPSNLLDLPPELIGRASRYLDVRKAEVRNFVSVAGPDIGRSIKHSYLKGNVDYLVYVAMKTYAKITMKKAKILRQKILQWMEINGGWKDAFKPYEGNAIPGMFADIELADKEKYELVEIAAMTRSGHLDLRLVPGGFCIEANIWCNVVVGIDGRDVTNLPFDAVKELLLRDREVSKVLRMIHYDVAGVFLNPAIAIDLGLTDFLRYLLEDIGLDVNCQQYRGETFNKPMPLVAHALVHSDSSSFQYLLTVKGIDLNPIMPEHCQHRWGRGVTLLHVLKSDVIMIAIGTALLDVTRVESILQRDEVDINIVDEEGFSPLKCVVQWDADAYIRSDFLLVKLFLDEGASKVGIDEEYLEDRDDDVHETGSKMLALFHAKDCSERDEVIASLEPQRKRQKT